MTGDVRWPAGPIRVPTTTDQVVATIAGAIENGDIAPATELRVSALCAELGVSPVAMRQAIVRLEAAGLVETQSNRSPIVVSPNAAWFLVLATTSGALSRLAAELGVPRLSSDQRQEFAVMGEAARALWSTEGSQLDAAIGVWSLFQWLAERSGNRHLATAHEAQRRALTFALRHLAKHRNATTLRRSLALLIASVEEQDALGTRETIDDLYEFLLMPHRS